MGITAIIYIITFFILAIILMVSIVVMRNERKINEVSEQFGDNKPVKSKK